MHAAAIAFHQPGASQREAAGARADWCAAAGVHLTKIVHDSAICPLLAAQQAAHYDCVIEPSWIAEGFPGRDLDPATRGDRNALGPDDGPPTMQLPTAVGFISGNSQCVDEGRARREREIRQ